MKTEHKIRSLILLSIGLLSITTNLAQAVLVAKEDFENPTIFDFSDLSESDHLGINYSNPYEELGVEFTGYVASTESDNIHGKHLATGFDNSPAEPFVVRVRLLGDPALKIGGDVWMEFGGDTSVTAFGDQGNIIERFVAKGGGHMFMGFEVPANSPIRYLEWRGINGAGLRTFPRVDGVMIETIPEPATLVLLGVGGLSMLRKRRI